MYGFRAKRPLALIPITINPSANAMVVVLPGSECPLMAHAGLDGFSRRNKES
jgi:hypothetical protein